MNTPGIFSNWQAEYCRLGELPKGKARLLSKILPTLIIASLGFGLVACSSNPETSPDGAEGCEHYSVSYASDTIEVCGELGKPNTVSFAGSLDESETAFSTVIEGSGDATVAGDSLMVAYSIYNGTTGEAISNADLAGSIPQEMVTLDSEQFLSGLVDAMTGQKVGSRVLALLLPEDAYGTEGNTKLGLGENDSLLWVLDILAKVEDHATGEPQSVDASLPTVTLADSGRPTVTIPAGDAPSELTLGVLKKGSGQLVEPEATVWVHYQGLNWRTQEIFDQSWGAGISSFPLTGVVDGFASAIEGQTVGSQVVVVIPPDLGYGPMGGQPGAGIEVDDTLVFVIDILAVKNP